MDKITVSQMLEEIVLTCGGSAYGSKIKAAKLLGVSRFNLGMMLKYDDDHDYKRSTMTKIKDVHQPLKPKIRRLKEKAANGK